MKQFIKTFLQQMVGIKPIQYKGQERCLDCGGRMYRCCPLRPARD